MVDIDEARRLCVAGKTRQTNHFVIRALQRGIDVVDAEYCLSVGEIIEQYPDDTPYPSCLVAGVDGSGKPLHVVCSVGVGEVWFITTYYPSEDRWDGDYKKRKGLCL